MSGKLSFEHFLEWHLNERKIVYLDEDLNFMASGGWKILVIIINIAEAPFSAPTAPQSILL